MSMQRIGVMLVEVNEYSVRWLLVTATFALQWRKVLPVQIMLNLGIDAGDR